MFGVVGLDGERGSRLVQSKIGFPNVPPIFVAVFFCGSYSVRLIEWRFELKRKAMRGFDGEIERYHGAVCPFRISHLWERNKPNLNNCLRLC